MAKTVELASGETLTVTEPRNAMDVLGRRIVGFDADGLLILDNGVKLEPGLRVFLRDRVSGS